MGKIQITDRHDEMERIGKELMAEKSDIYTEKMIASVMAVINDYAKDATQAEKQKIFYRSIYDYWVYGNNIAEEFYFHFSDKTHEEKLKYVSFRGRYLYIYRLNKKEDAHLLNDKFEAYNILKPYYRREIIQISSDADFDLFCDFVSRHPVFVAKPAALGLAIGVHKVDSSKYSDMRVLFNELLAEGADVKANYKWSNNSCVVIEELICQDERLAALHPQSVNCVRVTTIKAGGKTHIYYPWFKIGTNGNFVTSAAFGTLDAGIDSKTGVVITPGYKESGVSFEYHPQTGIKIPGFVIPEWDALVKTAVEVAEKLPTVGYTGWDFVLTPEGWCVMEGNFCGEFMWQMVYNRGMKAEIEELLQWKPEKEFWWE